MVEAITTVDELFGLLARTAGLVDDMVAGDVDIDILQHSLQCAEELAGARPDDAELQVAGLVHDLGHLLAPGDPEGHGRHGAGAVRDLLGDRVAALVELHVPAKRYLVATDASYASRLSPGSTTSLAHQGGPLSAAERAELDADPHLADALILRRADDTAKDPARMVPGLDRWHPVVTRVATHSVRR
ncbi:MAG: metal-dependent phosphohydrolase [Acidimicrobiales bacterium]|jgi:predicted HD phosphohydrolase|nr:metal-dependent phosphohydrolase [Acidimicrobiales bacterium]